MCKKLAQCVTCRSGVVWAIPHIWVMGYWCGVLRDGELHHIDVIMARMASQITSLTIVYSIVYSGADQRKHQSSASLAFVGGIYR